MKTAYRVNTLSKSNDQICCAAVQQEYGDEGTHVGSPLEGNSYLHLLGDKTIPRIADQGG